jgi:hypothetical protein
MSDYTLRITVDGKDVSSEDPRDFRMHGDYPLLKIKYQGDETSAIVANITGGVRITHSLGYQPMVLFYIGSSGNYSIVTGKRTGHPYVVTDNTYVYVYGSGLSVSSDFYFYIFADEF